MIVTDVAPGQRAGHPWLRHVAALPRKPLMVDLFATGADLPHLWPWSSRADMTAAATGQMALTGHAGAEPLQPEVPLAEYLGGALGALRAVAELRRGAQGHGARDVALPLHVAMQRMIEWQVPMATAMGKAEHRRGNPYPLGFSVSNMHLARDGKYVAVSAASEATAGRLLEMIGGRALREDPRFATLEGRRRNIAQLFRLLDDWIGARDLEQVLTEAAAHDVVMGAIHDAQDILQDEHMRSRGNVVHGTGAYARPLPMPGVVPRVTGWRAPVPSAGPALGAHTAEALHAGRHA